MKQFENLEDRFKDCARTIRRLAHDNPSFRELCEDYETATIALGFWEAPPWGSDARAKEYRDLVNELEADIRAVLHNLRSDERETTEGEMP